ncbi:MAG: LytTR family DNA-binding domain-containing protein [Clostridia bacterium]|nr:LytTR family DNA-binding domain-containing protein [Clostridia bacterium]
MLSIAILDDDENILNDYNKKISKWLKKNSIKGEIVISTNDPQVFLRELREKQVNVCIIDINLKSEVNGMYIAECIRKEGLPVEIIFSTGLLEYMPKAFDVRAYNFIAKPLNENLEKCLIKLNQDLMERKTLYKKIDVRFGSTVYYINIDDIVFIEHIGNKTVLHIKNRNIETYEGLEEIISRLDDKRFLQCHRSVYINIDFIESLNIKNKRLLMITGDTCEVGPKYYNIIKDKLEWSENSAN